MPCCSGLWSRPKPLYRWFVEAPGRPLELTWRPTAPAGFGSHRSSSGAGAPTATASSDGCWCRSVPRATSRRRARADPVDRSPAYLCATTAGLCRAGRKPCSNEAHLGAVQPPRGWVRRHAAPPLPSLRLGVPRRAHAARLFLTGGALVLCRRGCCSRRCRPTARPTAEAPASTRPWTGPSCCFLDVVTIIFRDRRNYLVRLSPASSPERPADAVGAGTHTRNPVGPPPAAELRRAQRALLAAGIPLRRLAARRRPAIHDTGRPTSSRIFAATVPRRSAPARVHLSSRTTTTRRAISRDPYDPARHRSRAWNERSWSPLGACPSRPASARLLCRYEASPIHALPGRLPRASPTAQSPATERRQARRARSGLPPTAFRPFPADNHDQIGTAAFGERLSRLSDRARAACADRDPRAGAQDPAAVHGPRNGRASGLSCSLRFRRRCWRKRCAGPSASSPMSHASGRGKAARSVRRKPSPARRSYWAKQTARRADATLECLRISSTCRAASSCRASPASWAARPTRSAPIKRC